jgi:DNA-binding LacI/PurR family transcriptional regulator
MSTLKEVAHVAGVSAATASLALNGRKVNEATRQRVLRTARHLNYVPNRVGRMLKASKSQTISLLFMTSSRHADIVRHTALFYYLIEGILGVVDESKYSLRLEVKSHEDPELAVYFENVVHDKSLDGIIIVPQFVGHYPFLELFQASRFPYVMFRPARFGSETNYVDIENAAGARLVADLFASLGCQRVAMINGPENHVDAIERERGFRQALASAGIADPAVKYGDFMIQTGFSMMGGLVREGPLDAVFCANDYMAAGAIKFLSESGRRVPHDVAVVGYDNNDICEGIVPSLTTVDHRLEELGRVLAQELLALIHGDRTVIRKSIPPWLIERDSHRKS